MPSNWWLNSQPGPGLPGGTTTGGGGYGGDGVNYRGELDARRSMAGQESAYPDGYLGTIVDRRQDRLLAKVQERLTDRSYQRGVHVGSKIGQGQYYWTGELNPETGLQRQAHAVQEGNVMVAQRFAPAGDPTERLAHMGKLDVDAARRYGLNPGLTPGMRAQLATMLPRWS